MKRLLILWSHLFFQKSDFFVMTYWETFCPFAVYGIGTTVTWLTNWDCKGITWWLNNAYCLLILCKVPNSFKHDLKIESKSKVCYFIFLVLLLRMYRISSLFRYPLTSQIANSVIGRISGGPDVESWIYWIN